jgi:heptaprenyl diphosphate synthase
MNIKKFTRLSMLISLAVVLSIIESFIPFINGMMIPGVKLGLANIIVLCVLECYSFKDAIYVSVLKVFLTSILRTGLFSMSFYFSLAGSILSIIAMGIVHSFHKFSMIGVSIVGSIFHSIGQILVAIVFLKNILLIHYLPFILFLSIPTGIITGILSKQLSNHLKNLL